MSRSVCAVVVTHNRKKLLLRCLTNIKQQTYKVSRILVIDNCSSDGSEDFIKKNLPEVYYSALPTLEWLRLKQNEGGAGGFFHGIKKFYEGKEDYVWLMDDDGYPDSTCLEVLIEDASISDFIGPLVLSDEDKTSLAFPIRVRGSLKNYDNINDLPHNCKKIVNCVLPFNGTLIGRKVVKGIGFPDPKFFIWGDEVDYTERARKWGANICTYCKSLYFHPKSPNLGKPMMFNLLRFNDTSSQLKLYCYCRNNFANKLKYSGVIFAALFATKALWFYAFSSPSIFRLKIVMKAIFHSLVNDFQQHSKYIKLK